ncbi:hypothetical protein Tco_0997102 [Tanacetum coccineum]
MGLTIAAAKDVAVSIQLLVHVVIPSHINAAFTYDICTVRTRKVTTVRVKKVQECFDDKKLQLLVLSDIGYYMFLVLGCEEDIGIKHIFVLGDQEISDR